MVKRRLCTLIACTLLLCAVLVNGKAVREDYDRPRPYIVMSQRGVGVQKIQDVLKKFNIPVDQVIQQPSQSASGAATAVVVQLPPSIASAVLSQPEVAATEKVQKFEAIPTNGDATTTSTAGVSLTVQNGGAPSFTGAWSQFATEALNSPTCPPWHLDRIDQRVLPLDCKYRVDHNGNGVDVYVVDTGVNTALPEFEGRASSFFTANGVATDEHGHGTFVASIVGGKTYGAAKGVNIKSVKVFDSTGSGTTITLMQGLSAVLYTRDRTRPAIVSMSLSGDGRSELIEWFVAALLADNVLVVTAAGNAGANSATGTNACQFSPGASTASLTVAASDVSDKLATWSNNGECVKVVAPGQDVFSVWKDGTHMALSGTSMATPVVAGTAAVLWGKLPGLSSKQVFRALQQNAATDVLAASSLAAGTPNMLVQASFSISPAPSPSDLDMMPGATVTPCTTANCPPPSTINSFSVAQFAGGVRRLARGKDAYVGKVFLSTDAGTTWSLVGLTASVLSGGSFTYNTAAAKWVCANPGMYISSRLQYGLAAFCYQGRAYLVHDVVGPFSGKLFFRAEPDPSMPIYNVLNVNTYGLDINGLVLLTDQQNIWLYAWRGGDYVAGTSGALNYLGEEWGVNYMRRWITMLSSTMSFDSAYMRRYYMMLMPSNFFDSWEVTYRRWITGLVAQQFDYVVSGNTYATYPALAWGGGTLDGDTMTRQYNTASTLGASWANSYTASAHMRFRPGFNVDTWVRTLKAQPGVFQSQSGVNTIFWDGSNLLFQSRGKAGKLSRAGTIDNFVTTGKTVLDAAIATTTPSPLDPAGTVFGTDSIFFGTADMFVSPGNITGASWGTSSGAVYPQYTRCWTCW